MLCVSSVHRSVSLHEGGGELQPPGDARPPVPPHTATESEDKLLAVYNERYHCALCCEAL